MAKGSLREVMPITAQVIDEFRKAFGTESVDRQLKRAMQGEPTFYAEENGHTFGTPSPTRTRVQWDEWGIPYVVSATGGKE